MKGKTTYLYLRTIIVKRLNSEKYVCINVCLHCEIGFTMILGWCIYEHALMKTQYNIFKFDKCVNGVF